MAAFQKNEALPPRSTDSQRLSRWVERDREDKRGMNRGRDGGRETPSVRLGDERATICRQLDREEYGASRVRGRSRRERSVVGAGRRSVISGGMDGCNSVELHRSVRCLRW